MILKKMYTMALCSMLLSACGSEFSSHTLSVVSDVCDKNGGIVKYHLGIDSHSRAYVKKVLCKDNAYFYISPNLDQHGDK